MLKNPIRPKQKNIKLTHRLRQDKAIYLFLLPGMLYYLIFCYGPMWGIAMSFQKYNPVKGFFGSPWIGLDNYVKLFHQSGIYIAFRNTLIISAGKIIFSFFGAIILALLINELVFSRSKRVLQTVYTFPHFMSWIVVSSIVFNLLSSDGAINTILQNFGLEPVSFLSSSKIFLWVIFVSDFWKEVGWSSIIYLASMSSIDTALYEAAQVDGANRIQRLWHVTLPGIKPTIVLLLLLAVGNSMNAGFDQVFNLYNATVLSSADILDTYIYRTTFNAMTPDFGMSIAAGLLKSCVNFFLLFCADRIAKAFGERGIF